MAISTADVQTALAQDAGTNPDNATCLGCHGASGFAAPRADGQARSLFVSPNMLAGSVHGKTSRCIDCHATLTEVPHTKVSRTRAEWRQKIPELCATCHPGARDDYLTSVHGAALTAKGDAAVCSDCHAAHSVARAKTPAARIAIATKCAECHSKDGKSYSENYHGQVLALGYAETATCADCHGAHAIRRSSDPKSSVAPGNLLQTCLRCHPEATAGFASFHPHATTDDFERYPYEWLTARFMFAIVVFTFGIFWTHSVLWFYREYRDRRERKARPHVLAESLPAAKDRYVTRWSAMWRIAHLVFALSFIVLTVTGITLLYPSTAWAPPLERLMGGPSMASTIHKVSAVIMIAIFVAHLVYMLVHIARTWKTFELFGPYSVMPNLQDARDIVAMCKWFIGRGPRPMFDHWNYMQKVDYWAPFWGIAMLAASGAMLWYKELTAAYLPGWIFNVATIVHGEEALLAAFYLFTIHYFVNHWRPDKFPLDNVMFTGSMPLEEFKREYAVEYKRLLEAGQLEAYLVDAPSRPMTLGYTILGLSLIAVGLVLVVVMTQGIIVNRVAG
ncbi:MAG: cytochrome b/b6 domain-containing protein [Betaproteobacteria bacterium]|nr:cytochrome b/b6 domain-containing protein [Betaproteobacteria bacterium]